MAHTTLASTDRALEKIGDFVTVQDYASLKAVGRTFAHKAGVIVGFRRSIPKRYAKKANVIWSCSARSRSASPWPARQSPRSSWKI